jgi:hypothetical protein
MFNLNNNPSKENQELNTTLSKEEKSNTNKLKKLTKNKSPDKELNTKPLKENTPNKFPEKKYGLTTKPLNTKKNIFPELNTTPFLNKFPFKE